jgi:hypothetical protein
MSPSEEASRYASGLLNIATKLKAEENYHTRTIFLPYV